MADSAWPMASYDANKWQWYTAPNTAPMTGVEMGKTTEAQQHNYLHRSMERTFNSCLAISKAKNADYANDIDPFANFRRAEDVGVSVERGILVRLTDKIARINNLLEKDPAVKDESLFDSCDDAINYIAILKAYRGG